MFKKFCILICKNNVDLILMIKKKCKHSKRNYDETHQQFYKEFSALLSVLGSFKRNFIETVRNI